MTLSFQVPPKVSPPPRVVEQVPRLCRRRNLCPRLRRIRFSVKLQRTAADFNAAMIRSNQPLLERRPPLTMASQATRLVFQRIISQTILVVIIVARLINSRIVLAIAARA
uniref:Uncharacterized protein n=1 Tax=Cacopsylla melanoneura TaxID=428564 RepID=A0A8D8WAP7_9HEMI